MDVVMSEVAAVSTMPEVIEEVDLTGGNIRLPAVDSTPASEYYGEWPMLEDDSGVGDTKVDPVSPRPTAMLSDKSDDLKTHPAVSEDGKPSAEQASLIAEYMKNMPGDYMTRQLAAYRLVMGGLDGDGIVVEDTVRKHTSRPVTEESRLVVANNAPDTPGSWSRTVSPAGSMKIIESKEVSGTPGSNSASDRTHAESKSMTGTDVVELSDDEDEPITPVQPRFRSAATQDKQVGPCTSGNSKASSKTVEDKPRVMEKPKQEKEVVSLVDDSDDGEVKEPSAADKQRIAQLEATLKKNNIHMRGMREAMTELEETVEDLKDGSNLSSKMVTLRRQNKNALSAMKRANNESMANVRTAAAEKIEGFKEEYEGKKEQWKNQMNNTLKKRFAEIEKKKQSAEETRQASKAKLEENKNVAAELRAQKAQNTAEVEALKKKLREELEEEKLSCRPERNRLVQDRDEQIKDLKAELRERDKERANAKADMTTYRKGIQDEIGVATDAKKYAEELHMKYTKYKTYAQRLHADLKAQEVKHGDDKAELVTKHEQQQFKQEQKWSLQWNIAQQKSSEVVSLSRVVSELRNGLVRKDALIAELREKLENTDREVMRPGNGASRTGPVVIGEDADEHMTIVAPLAVPSDRPSTSDLDANAENPSFATSRQQPSSKNQTPEPSTLPDDLANAPRKPQQGAADASPFSRRSVSPGTLAYSRMPSALRAKTELPQSVPKIFGRRMIFDSDIHVDHGHDSNGGEESDEEPQVLGGKRKAAVAASEEPIAKWTRIEDE